MLSLLQQCTYISVVTPEFIVGLLLLLNAYIRRPKKAAYHYRDKNQCMLPIKVVLQKQNPVGLYIYKYFKDLETLTA